MAAWRCQQDGACCRELAAVALTREELALIDAHPGAAHAVYTVQDTPDGRLLLKAGPCPFLAADGRCGVYDVRPLLCRQYACGRDNPKTEPFDPTAAVPARFYTDRAFRRQHTHDRRKALSTWGTAHGWPQGVR